MIPGDIEKAIADQTEKAYKTNYKLQPFIVVEGQSLVSINNSYLVVVDLTLQLDSPRQVFDTRLNLFFVANAVYPPQTEHLYLIIEKCIYNINSEEDKTFPHVMDLLELLK